MQIETTALRDLPKGEYFKRITSGGKLNQRVYIKGEFDRSEQAFICLPADDCLGNGLYIKANRQVFTGFTY